VSPEEEAAIRHAVSPEEEEAVRHAGDPDRLLPNENPQTNLAEDARHWRRVYRELLDFKESLLSVADRGLAEIEQELKVTDTTAVAVLRAQNERLRRRLGFWEGRHRELSAK